MKSSSVAVRLAWRFAAVFVFGLLIIAAVSYYELVMEPASEPETLRQGVTEVAAEASLVVAVLVAAGWWFARRALLPAEKLAAAAERIDEGNLNETISIPGSGAEFEKLAEVFNSMTARLDASFQRVRQFTLYASHELKTPLAILRAEFEKLTDDPQRSEADRALFGSHLEEIERLTNLVDGLTFLTKADAHLIPIKPECVELTPLLTNAFEDTKALGADWNLCVSLTHCDDLTMNADRQRLRQLLVILCDNAVKYNRQGGTVTLAVEQDGTTVVLRIANSGPGIPADEQSHVFDRFYRGSGAVADGVQGMGLGLNIAQWIVGGHGGTLTFDSTPDCTEFVARFPRGEGNHVTPLL
jgi:signal transduction histidine kinase